MEVSVSEIHGYPLRPEGYAEPLFRDGAAKREIGVHLLKAPWLFRASELTGGCGESAHARREKVRLRKRRERVEVQRRRGEARVVEVFRRWREVREWWEEDSAVDRTVVRARLSDGSVVDLARERGVGGGWFLVGVTD